MLIKLLLIILFEHSLMRKKYDCEVMEGAEIFIL